MHQSLSFVTLPSLSAVLLRLHRRCAAHGFDLCPRPTRTRLRARRPYLGITCILTVVCTNYSGFVAQRFFLGLMESAVSPAFVTVTALWYKPQEQAVRFGIWYSATGVSVPTARRPLRTSR